MASVREALKSSLKLAFFRSEPIKEHYKFCGELGKGSFARVVHAKRRDTGESVAIKCIQKGGKTTVKLLEAEVSILNIVSHPNCVSVQEIFDTPKTLYLVMDMCLGGELLKRISLQERFSEREASILVKDLLLGLEYLHSLGIIHRDLKPENLLFADDPVDSRLQITDFGLSKILQGKHQFLFSRCGTPAYVSPELLLGKPYDGKVDLWAAGVITYLLIAGYAPFWGETMEQLFDKIIAADFAFHAKYWEHVSNAGMHFVEQHLEPNTDKRFTASQALQHPWITGDFAQKKKTLQSMPRLRAYATKRSNDVSMANLLLVADDSPLVTDFSAAPPSAAAGSSFDVSLLSKIGRASAIVALHPAYRHDPWKYFADNIAPTRVAAGRALESSAQAEHTGASISPRSASSS